MLCQVYLAVCECEQITLHQPVRIENGRCFKPVPLHTSGSRVPQWICKSRSNKPVRRSWPMFFLPTPNQRGHSKSPFTPLIPKLNLMKILSCGISPNTSELLAPGSLKEFARHLIPAKPAFRGTGNRSIVAIQSTVTPRFNRLDSQ